MKFVKKLNDFLVIEDSNFLSSILGGILFSVAGFSVAFIINGEKNWVSYIVGISFIVAGLIMIIKSSSIILEVDKQKINFKKKGLFGEKNEVYYGKDILKIELRRITGYVSNNNSSVKSLVQTNRQSPQMTYQYIVVYKDRQEFPLSNLKSKGSFNRVLASVPNEEILIVNEIANLLGVSFVNEEIK